MGWIKYNAIIVTTWDTERMEKVRVAALGFFREQQVSPVMESPTNGYATVFIAPDGSKEGWDASNDGNKAREDFFEWMRKEPDLYVDAVDVGYGEIKCYRVEDSIGSGVERRIQGRVEDLECELKRLRGAR